MGVYKHESPLPGTAGILCKHFTLTTGGENMRFIAGRQDPGSADYKGIYWQFS